MDRDEQAIRKLIKKWLDASRSGDTKTVLSLMAPESIEFLERRRVSSQRLAKPLIQHAADAFGGLDNGCN